MINLTNITYHGDGDWVTLHAYVIALAHTIDEPPAIVMAYLRSNPWCAIGQRICATYGIDYSLNGGYPSEVGRDFVEDTSVAELSDLAQSVRAWELHLRYLYIVARNAGAYEN